MLLRLMDPDTDGELAVVECPANIPRKGELIFLWYDVDSELIKYRVVEVVHNWTIMQRADDKLDSHVSVYVKDRRKV